MMYTVNAAFDVFRSQHVDLDTEQVKKARISRTYLKEQLGILPNKADNFPPLYGNDIFFGSFDRKTKLRPLDDLDMLCLLGGKDTTSSLFSGYTYNLEITNALSPLWQYTNSNDAYLNSTKILNKFKNSLSLIANYRKAEIKRTGAAVVLDLNSYSWVFDIVPSFPVSDGLGGIAYYLIPDGDSRWIRTDPRKDQRAITTANTHHNSNLIPLIRLMKYWNRHYYDTPELPSYYFETMIINGSHHYQPITNIRLSIPLAFEKLATTVLTSCPDPKNLGPNLDINIPLSTKVKICEKATLMAQYARYAILHEEQGNHKEAISWWKTIFSPDFPQYGG